MELSERDRLRLAEELVGSVEPAEESWDNRAKRLLHFPYTILYRVIGTRGWFR